MIVKLAFAFGAGFISFLTPCVLPIIPGYISYITGKDLREIDKDKSIVLTKTILFSLGFSFIFVILGAAASAIGNALLFFSNELRIIAGLIIIIFSLQMLGFLNFSFLNTEKRIQTTSNYKDNYAFPFIVGAAFAFGWTPCIGPVLGSIIALSATEATISSGILLLSFYSLGLAIPFILSGYYMSRFLTTKKGFGKYYETITKTGGVILLITGILITTNYVQIIATETYCDFRSLQLYSYKNFILSLDYKDNSIISQNEDYKILSPKKVICMSLDNVGKNIGPNKKNLESTKNIYPSSDIVVSGGIRHNDDILSIKNMGFKEILLLTAILKKNIKFDKL